MKVYVDMDGVLANFERRYFERYGELPGSMRDKKEFNNYWDDFVLTKQFETLELWPGATELLQYLDSQTAVEKEILSSSGGPKYHDNVTEQKKVWLKKFDILYPANIVSGRKNKSLYAKPDTVLIDDTSDVITAFNKAGGIGILHKEIGNTLMLLDKVIASLTK
jgi:beta-phosphoglucomutase-like phosphatase (HAD superfamily)